MKFVLSIVVVIVCAVCSVAGVHDSSGEKKSGEGAERSIATDPSVTVTLCVMAGQITVRGWDKNEVRARSSDVEGIELRRVGEVVDATKPAKKIDVYIVDKSDRRVRGDCQASADLELDVPKGATVQIQTRDGDIDISGVEAAYAGSQNGDICIEHVSEIIEAGSIGGGISLKDSSGRVSLSSAGGGIDVSNVTPMAQADVFEVVSVSGDIQLQKVTHAKLAAKSVTGNINLTGPLARSGNYGFSTMSGDITLAIPPDSSFRLIAKLAQDGEISTDFPLTLTTEPAAPAVAATPRPRTGPAHPTPQTAPAAPPSGPTPAPSVNATKKADAGVAVVKVTPVIPGPVMAGGYPVRRVIGVCGTGDATLTVNSFSGNLHLQKN
jgi:hypothetical protein